MAVYLALGEHATKILVQREDGAWVPGRLEATMTTDMTWSGQVRFTDLEGREQLDWVDAERIDRGRILDQRAPHIA